LQGHDQGILSLSWCQQDSDLLLSCGKDNRTIFWNPQTGERLGEFPEVTNWTFQTRFNPHNPNLSATASFDGKIAVQTLQNTNPSVSQTAVQGSADGEDFFAKAQTQPQGASFTLVKAPKWLERPVGASFGFGGKLVSFQLQKAVAGQPGSSKIQILQFSVDSDVGTATESFEKALNAGDIKTICETHIAQAKTEEERADWQVIETLISDNPRKHVTEYLGFSESGEGANGADSLHISANDGQGKLEDQNGEETQENGSTNKTNRLSTFFADGADHDDFLSNIFATKDAKTNNPFEMYSESDSPSDRQITKALMLGQFEKAMTICLKEERMADAFIIANCGGKELVERAQTAYLSRKAKGPNYIRLLASVIGKNLWDIVYNADLANWKESMATLCTYADPNEFPDLCEALGDRVLENGLRKDASFCYLVGSKLEKVIGIWISELQENELASMQEPSGDSTFSVHARSLQNFIEKVTVFRDVTKFQDKEQEMAAGWKLAPLYDRYIEYADIVAAHGHLNVAEKYLGLLPAQYAAAEVARNRVKQASRTAAPQMNIRQQQPSSTRTAPRAQPVAGFQPQQAPSAIQTPTPGNIYSPSATSVSSNPYAPPNTNVYTPQQGYLPSQQQSSYGGPAILPPTGYTQGGPHSSFGAPPRNTAPSIPPPSRATNVPNWNDTPMVTKPAISRRSTPGITPAPITSPFPNQQNMVLPPSAPPFGGPRGAPTPPPPPPKGSAPRMTSPLLTSEPSSFQQPTKASTTANIYAPPPQSSQQHGQQPLPSTIARGPSPYNPPPSGPPPNSRYAPTPAAQFSQPQLQSPIPPPPQASARAPPPSNPYAPPQSSPMSNSPYAPASASSYHPQPQLSQTSQNPQFPPAQGPPQNSRPSTAQSQFLKAPALATPKYPPGDRSHIPASAQKIVSIFTNDMQRVASKAPASFSAQVKDTQKRLNILFDHLNNEDLIKPDTIKRLDELAYALQAKDYNTATHMQVDIQREKLDECGQWMVRIP
jgi:protein transport protein SEC31